MKLFGQYLKQRRWEIALYVVFVEIFLGCLWLYRLPLAAAVYPAVLCSILGGGLLVRNFFRIRKNQQMLDRIRSMTDLIAGTLPSAQSIQEQDYQRLLQRLEEECGVQRAQADRRYTEMIDYYTVWAHQIKTPIASMQLNLQSEDSALARAMKADLGRIEQYVEMVLTFLRLESESTDYLIREYDLDSIVRQAVKKFSAEFIGRRLRLEYQPLNTTVITDEKWLGFVVEQVLSNALKYTRSGSISITLEPEKTLCIRDTGMGIAPEDLPRIFENGYTGYNGRADKKASGIGLYLCRRICKNLGHSITAQSVPDEGTTIRIDLAQRKLEVE